MTTRRKVLFSGAALGLLGLPALRTLVSAATGASAVDLNTLNVAIELEHAGIKAYQDASATALLSSKVAKVAGGFMRDHIAHRDALIAAVTAGGGTPSAKTSTLPYPKLTSERDILEFAKSVEERALRHIYP